MSGAELTPGDDWGNLIYMSLCMDQGSGHTLQARFVLCTAHRIAHTHIRLAYADMKPCCQVAVMQTQGSDGLKSTARSARCPILFLQGSGDPSAGEAWMLKMSEWAPQSLGGSMSAGEALDPKGDEGKCLLDCEAEPAVLQHIQNDDWLHFWA